MKYISFVATIAFATLVLVGCGTNVVTPNSSSTFTTSSAVASSTITDALEDEETATASDGEEVAVPTVPVTETVVEDTSVVESISSSSVEVIELTSSTINYDGEHGRNNGRDQLTVTVSLEDGMITDVSLSQTAGHGESRRYQSAFASAIKSQVIGKTLAQATVGRVGGASNTSDAWNKALSTL